MGILEGIGIVVFTLLALLAVLYARRAVIGRRGGTVDVSLRLTTLVSGRGWAYGLARFAGDDMRWYRVFSFAPSPRCVLSRRELAVEGRRRPAGTERVALPADWVVVRCVSAQSAVEIAMAETTLTGFLSWIEAAPGGAASRRLAAH
jgi:hypothetical protein